MITNVYLDIDGVLLLNDEQVSPFAKEFLMFILERYPENTYWLTTHCKGDSSIPIEHVGHLFDFETRELMKKIKPTDWDVKKTDGIDFSKPFLWFDDDCFECEKKVLRENNVLDNWIEVDLRNDPNMLKRFIDDFPLSI